jgi:NAD(P)H-dependent flavin oxidoreductase YrpB (nitropropane dioxygenase family)
MFRSYRNTARVAKNAVAVEAVRIEREGNPFEAVAHLVKGARGREGLLNGDPEHGVWTAGMVQGLIHDVPTVKDLVERIVAEAEALIAGRLAAMTGA